MEVLYYQIFISLSIVSTRLIAQKYLIHVCGFWTLFTVINLFYPPLIIIQLIVVWGTYFLVAKPQAEPHAERKSSSHISSEISDRIPQGKYTDTKIISGREHTHLLAESISKAEREIVILSGWVSDRVINDELIDLFREAVKRRCIIFIVYGYQNFDGVHTISEAAKTSLDQLLRINDAEGKLLSSGQIYIAEAAIHEKILAVDNKYCVFGSHNWLSNSAFKNDERSLLINDADLTKNEILRVKEQYFYEIYHSKDYRNRLVAAFLSKKYGARI